jgi:hypothetical protein
MAAALSRTLSDAYRRLISGIRLRQVRPGFVIQGRNQTVLAENLIALANVELADVTLLPFPNRARPYINSAQFPSHRASRPSRYANDLGAGAFISSFPRAIRIAAARRGYLRQAPEFAGKKFCMR